MLFDNFISGVYRGELVLINVDIVTLFARSLHLMATGAPSMGSLLSFAYPYFIANL